MTAAERFWLTECLRHGADPTVSDGTFLVCPKDETARERHLNAIVPVSFACVGERIVASAYPSNCSLVRAHFEKYCSPDMLFSEEAFSALDTALRPHLAAWGYKPAMFGSRYGVSLIQDRADAVPISAILDGTVRITDTVCGMKNLTSMKPADCAARGAYAQIADGQIVCIASVNNVFGTGTFDTERFAEIGVECAPDYRRRGYAASCVSALTRDLCGAGTVVVYRHYHTNQGSAAVAKTAGFQPVGRFFSYTSFAI